MLAGYDLLQKLSDGASAEVVLAREQRSSQTVVLEIARPELCDAPEGLTLFLGEVEVRRRLSHPNVARRVLEGCTSDGRPYLVSEPLGPSVAELLAARGTLAPEEAVWVALSVCDALHYLHELGVVHGNLKPSTVFLPAPGEAGGAKLLDCGLSLLRTGLSLAAHGPPLVEATYLSPERIRGRRATASSDIYGLGILLYEMLTGRAPFAGEQDSMVRQLHLCSPPTPLPPALEPLWRVVQRCLAKNPAGRFQDALAVARELGREADPEELPEAEFVLDVEDAPPSLEGTVLGSYQLIEPLGEGAMGRVFLARHVRLGRLVALKLLRGELAASPEQVLRFFDEARAVNRTSHEHIVEIHDFVDEVTASGERRVYCVMELLRGQPLSRLRAEGTLTVERTLRILRQVAQALHAAHAVGVVHRDVKPDNVFVIDRGGGDFAKVLDFGVAKLREAPGGPTASTGVVAEERTRAGMVVGTPPYMAPEQALGRPVDHRTDIWALGVVLYRLITGKAPFAGGTFAQLCRAIVAGPSPELPELSSAGEPVPPAVAHLVRDCLQKAAKDRPQSMAEVAMRLGEILQALETGLTEQPAEVEEVEFDFAPPPLPAAPPAALPESKVLVRKRWRGWSLATGAVAACAACLALVLLLTGQPQQKEAAPQPPPPEAKLPSARAQPYAAPGPELHEAPGGKLYGAPGAEPYATPGSELYAAPGADLLAAPETHRQALEQTPAPAPVSFSPSTDPSPRRRHNPPRVHVNDTLDPF